MNALHCTKASPVWRWLLFISLPFLLSLVAVPVFSQSGGDYELSWWSADAGGYAVSKGGDYALGGTVGQSDAGLLTGGDFTLAGGFWEGGAAPPAEDHEIYLPVVLRIHDYP